jgi:hypothetical protein
MKRPSQTQARKKSAKRRRKLERKKKAALALDLKVGKELDEELERQELRRRLELSHERVEHGVRADGEADR